MIKTLKHCGLIATKTLVVVIMAPSVALVCLFDGGKQDLFRFFEGFRRSVNRDLYILGWK